MAVRVQGCGVGQALPTKLAVLRFALDTDANFDVSRRD